MDGRWPYPDQPRPRRQGEHAQHRDARQDDRQGDTGAVDASGIPRPVTSGDQDGAPGQSAHCQDPRHDRVPHPSALL